MLNDLQMHFVKGTTSLNGAPDRPPLATLKMVSEILHKAQEQARDGNAKVAEQVDTSIDWVEGGITELENIVLTTRL